MTLKLNFDKAKQKKLIALIEWLQEVGLVTSFKIEEGIEDEISDEEADEILTALEDVESGNYLTHEEVLKNLKNG